MKYLYNLFILSFFSFNALAQADSNIYINKAIKNIEIVYNSKSKKIEVIENVNLSYQSSQPNSNYSFNEFYDDKTKIEDLKYNLDKKINPSIWKAEDSYYQSNDIFYSDARVKYFDLNLPKQGSELNVSYKRITDDPRYFGVIYFSENYKVNSFTVKITIPNWFIADIKEFNFDGYNINKTQEKLKDKTVITYSGEGLSALKNESFTRGLSYTYPHLLFLSKTAEGPITETYFPNLNQQFKWYKSLLLPETDLDIIKNKALEITSKALNEQDKIDLIYYWIQDNIRYIAFENGIAGFRPAFASEVLNKKYGDCKGMANLACQMLKSIDIDARLCWLGTNHLNYDYSTPCLFVDNHMICAVIKNGKPFILDPTETYLSINENAERIQNREILIDNGDSYILFKNPQRDYKQNLIHINTSLIINDLSLIGDGRYLMMGESKSGFLNGYNSLKTNKMTEALENYVSNNDDNYKIKINKQSNFSNYSKNLDFDYNINYKNAITKFDNEIYIDLDHNKEFKSLDIEQDKRKADIFFPYKYNIQHITKLQIPEGYSLKSKPADLDIDQSDYKLKANYIANGNEIIYQKEIIIKNCRIDKTKLAQLVKDFNALNQFYQETITLSK